MLPIAIDAMETIYEATDYAPYLSDFAEEGCSWKYALCIESVSYTHLTLPTIYSV